MRFEDLASDFFNKVLKNELNIVRNNIVHPVGHSSTATMNGVFEIKNYFVKLNIPSVFRENSKQYSLNQLFSIYVKETLNILNEINQLFIEEINHEFGVPVKSIERVNRYIYYDLLLPSFKVHLHEYEIRKEFE